MNDQACGRPTRSGKPCQAGRQRGHRACGSHETSEDKAYAEGWSEAWRVSQRDFDDNARQWVLKQRGYEVTSAERKLREFRLCLERLLGIQAPQEGDRSE